ncbi:MAG: hypothetical protein RLZZ303_2791, partial [Candidatus Hydrogenedentota bacterium]
MSFSWYSWVVRSSQQVDHASTDILRAELKGEPTSGITIKSGKFTDTDFGASYGRIDGESYFVWEGERGSFWALSPEQHNQLKQLISDQNRKSYSAFPANERIVANAQLSRLNAAEGNVQRSYQEYAGFRRDNLERWLAERGTPAVVEADRYALAGGLT